MNTSTFKAKQVRSDIPIENTSPFKEGLIVTIILFVPCLLLWYYEFILLGTLSFIGIFIFIKPIAIYLRSRYPDWAIPKDITGTVVFLSNKIETISTHEISKINIQYNKQRDRKLGYRHEPIHNGLVCFDILYKNGKEDRLIVLLEKKEQFDELGKILKETVHETVSKDLN